MQTRSKSGCLIWLKRVLLSIVIMVVVLLAAGFIYQQQATARDLEAYPPPGKLVKVDNIDMHIYCEGEGTPTVILESGLGAYSLAWWTIRETVTQETRTCVYDRASMGWSSFTDTVSTHDIIIDNLHTLLDNAGETPPYILVGHSAGGVYVRAYAKQYPDEIAGMILVDSSHENSANRLPEYIVSASTSPDTMLEICPYVSPFGVRRLLSMGETFVSDFYSDETIRGAAIANFYRSTYCSALLNEIAGFALDTQQDDPPPDLGDLPLIVLTAGRGYVTDTDSIEDSEMLATLQEADRVWNELQEELAGLSTNSTHIIVEDSGHVIQGDRPDAVIDAIRDMLDVTRDA